MGIFDGVRWGVIGDSLSINLSAQRGNYPFVIDDASTGISIVNMANSGKGYYNSSPKFYEQVDSLTGEFDIITIFGSTNDRALMYSGAGELRYKFAAYQTPASGSMGANTLLTSVVNPHLDDYDTPTTLAGYINKAIHLAKSKIKAGGKVIVVPAIFRGGSGNTIDAGTHNAAITTLKTAQGWISSNQEGAASWLSVEPWFVTNFNTYLSDDTVVEKDPLSSNYGGNLDFRKTSPALLVPNWTSDQAEEFAQKFWNHAGGDGTSIVHPNKVYHQAYLAPKFANAICGVLGIDPAGLPESLKLNNLNPATTYTATFVADGVTVDTVVYEAGAYVLPRVPDVPAKTGYTGAWEPYTLADADITINAVYTAVEPEPPSGGVLSVHLRLASGGTITNYDELPPWVRERLENGEKLWYMKDGRKIEITWG